MKTRLAPFRAASGAQRYRGIVAGRQTRPNSIVGKTSKLARARPEFADGKPFSLPVRFLRSSSQSFSFPSFLSPTGTINSSFECVLERSKLHPSRRVRRWNKTPGGRFRFETIRTAFCSSCGGRTRERLTPARNVSTRIRARLLAKWPAWALTRLIAALARSSSAYRLADACMYVCMYLYSEWSLCPFESRQLWEFFHSPREIFSKSWLSLTLCSFEDSLSL